VLVAENLQRDLPHRRGPEVKAFDQKVSGRRAIGRFQDCPVHTYNYVGKAPYCDVGSLSKVNNLAGRIPHGDGVAGVGQGERQRRSLAEVKLKPVLV